MATRDFGQIQIIAEDQSRVVRASNYADIKQIPIIGLHALDRFAILVGANGSIVHFRIDTLDARVMV